MTTGQTPRIPAAFRITYDDNECRWWITANNYKGGEVVPAEIAYDLLATAEAALTWLEDHYDIRGHMDDDPLVIIVLNLRTTIAAARPEQRKED